MWSGDFEKDFAVIIECAGGGGSIPLSSSVVRLASRQFLGGLERAGKLLGGGDI